MVLTEKERLQKVLQREVTDRPPCICPGGMMNMITTDLMDACGIAWPDAHVDARKMADLAMASYEHKCFENVGVPFCMTVEAEALGAGVTMGTKIYEPHVTQYAIDSVSRWQNLNPLDVTKGRAKVVTDAIRILKSRDLDVPIVGNVTGPISVATSLMEPADLYKSFRKCNQEAHEYLAFVTEQIIKFARAQIEAGADIIAISDPSGTGEILGPKYFEEFAVKYLNILIDGLQQEKMGTIVHICGQMKNVYKQINMVKSDVLSFDSIVSMREAGKNLPDRILMGNVSTYTLEYGEKERIKVMTEKCVSSGSDIVSPACGLGTRSPLANIQTILQTVKETHGKDDQENRLTES